MYLLRAFAAWLVIMCAESVHGTLRMLYLAPRLGDGRARQLSMITGALVIFAAALWLVRWIAALSAKALLAVGLLWVVLTFMFEAALGRLAFGYSWERVFAEYNPARGGLMGLGLLFMLFAPLLAARVRGLRNF